MIQETKRGGINGYLASALLFAGTVLGGWWLVGALRTENTWGIIIGVAVLIGISVSWAGLFIVNPNEAKVLQLFGDYMGTIYEPGLNWANPFYAK